MSYVINSQSWKPVFRAIRGPLAVGILIIGVWEYLVISRTFPPVLLPGILSVASTFVSMIADGTLLINTAATLSRMFLGYFVAVIAGVTAGLLMGRSQLSEELGVPLVSFLLPIPSLAIVPLFTIWFGLGATPTIALVIFVSIPPIVVNTWAGLKSVDPVLLRAAQACGVRGARLFTRVLLPGSLPGVLAGLRFGLSVAWRAVIAGELISATTTGLGWLLFDAREWLRTDQMFVTLMTMALLGMLMERVGFAAVDRMTVERWGMVTASRDSR